MVGPERGACFAIRPADTLLIDEVTPAQNGPGHSRQHVLVHMALHCGAHVGEIASFGAHVPLPVN